MRSRGSLSTILAGVLVLVALTMGIIMGATVLSTITTLSNLAANHVRTVGEESATYSGLIIQGGALVSTKGPVTVIGAVSPDGSFTWINETAQTYTANTTEPQLLLTNVGPVLLDPTQPDTNNQAIAGNPISAYLWHWVEAAVTTNQGAVAVPGVIIMLGNQYYLLKVGSPLSQYIKLQTRVPLPYSGIYFVGPLTGSNTGILFDYGVGPSACTLVMYWCPAGQWPSISITQINSTAIRITLHLAQWYTGTPLELFILDQEQPRWLANVEGITMGGYFNTTINLPAPVPSKYYVIVNELNSLQWYVWNVTNNMPSTPTWLLPPGPNASLVLSN